MPGSSKNSREVFRHLRPQQFDPIRAEIVPNPFGGLSFLAKPVADGVYHFWVYICPDKTPFSARQAVKELRDREVRDIVPFGTITSDGAPLLDQIIANIFNVPPMFPSSVKAQATKIISSMNNAATKRNLFIESAKGKETLYEDYSIR